MPVAFLSSRCHTLQYFSHSLTIVFTFLVNVLFRLLFYFQFQTYRQSNLPL